MREDSTPCGKESKEMFTHATTLLTQATFTSSAESRVQLISKARDILYKALEIDKRRERKERALRNHSNFMAARIERFRNSDEGEGI